MWSYIPSVAELDSLRPYAYRNGEFGDECPVCGGRLMMLQASWGVEVFIACATFRSGWKIGCGWYKEITDNAGD